MTDFSGLKTGLTAERLVTIEGKHTVSHTGRPVLSTPMMISLMESVAMHAVQPQLPAGFTTVGYEVHVRHRAPATEGVEIKIGCRLLEVEGRRLLFEVRVSAGEKTIGEGLHRRTIIPVAG
jgi:predicted thioesterase